MLVSTAHQQIIEEKFKVVRELAKNREEELFGVLRVCTEEEAICLKYLYAFMPEQDLANHDGRLFLDFVKHALKVRSIVPWGEKLTGGLFLNYILQYRMSNENIEFYKDILFDEIYPRIEGKSMYEAALIINYWCFEKATYQTTNARTTCPLTTIRNAYGRCGEESVLGVAAFRSVGIPARQAFTPRWAHCDDNHAWVEVWIDGDWHFLGACEPEATLDSGWFQLSASRGMLIGSRVFSTTVENEVITRQTDTATDVNTLHRYADTKDITIKVVDEEGNPVQKAYVGFEVVNYAQLFPIIELQTDEEGKVTFMTGYGDLLIYVHKEGQATYEKMDVRLEDELKIVLKDKPRTHKMVETLTLVPPTGKTPDENAVTDEMKEKHEVANTHALEVRKAFVETFYLGEKALEWAKKFEGNEEGVARHLESARGNYKEVQAFFEDEETICYTEDKIKMLDTMQSKDLSDTTSEILKEHLLYAITHKGQYEETVFVEGILAPRVASEKITAYRKELLTYFTQQQIESFRVNPRSIYDYVADTIGLTGSSQNTFLCAQPIGVMKLKVGHTISRKILFVALCRTFGIPAKINRAEGSISYYEKNGWTTIDLDTKQEIITKDSTLTLRQLDDTVYEYMKTYTIGKWHNGVYRTLYLDSSDWTDGKKTYAVEAGSYRILTVNREASGTAHINLYYVDLQKGEAVTVDIALATVEQATKEITVEDTNFVGIDGVQCQLSEVATQNNTIVAYLDAGAEPTEHLLNEMIGAKEQYIDLSPEVILIVKEVRDLENPTLQKTLEALPFIKVYVGYEKEVLNYLYEGFEILDKKFPLAFVMPTPMKANVAIAGYSVGIGTMLLKYLQTTTN